LGARLGCGGKGGSGIEVPEEVWLPPKRLVLLKVWRLARAGLGPEEVGKRLGVSDKVVRRALEELAGYGAPSGDAGCVRCYYLSPEELALYGPCEKGSRALPVRWQRVRGEDLERELAGGDAAD